MLPEGSHRREEDKSFALLHRDMFQNRVEHINIGSPLSFGDQFSVQLYNLSNVVWVNWCAAKIQVRLLSGNNDEGANVSPKFPNSLSLSRHILFFVVILLIPIIRLIWRSFFAVASTYLCSWRWQNASIANSRSNSQRCKWLPLTSKWTNRATLIFLLCWPECASRTASKAPSACDLYRTLSSSVSGATFLSTGWVRNKWPHQAKLPFAINHVLNQATNKQK